MKEPTIGTKKRFGPIAFLPLLVFLAIYLGAGILFTCLGTPDPFKQIPREAALVCGLIVALCMGKEKLDFKVDVFAKNAGDSGIMLMSLIFLLAGAFAGSTKAMGGADSAVNLGLSLVPLQFIFAGVFIISALIATAMGTSMGTIAAIGPIAVGLAERANISSAIAIAAVLGGSMFGDNLSIISDTTIAATRGAGCKMNDKFKMNLLIALPAALVAIVIYCFVGTSGTLDGEFHYNLIHILPYLVVLITAIAGANVIVVLLSGTILSGIIGIATGTLSIVTFAQSVASGMTGMFNLVIIAIFVRGLTGIVKEYGGIDWLIGVLTRKIKTRKGAEYGIAAMVGLIDASLCNNTMAIIISAPLSKTIAKVYNIAPKRIASLLDIFSCVIQGIIPHGGQLLLCTTLTGLSPLAVLSANYYIYLLAIAAVVTIQFGLLRTKEEKENVPLYTEDDETMEAESL